MSSVDASSSHGIAPAGCWLRPNTNQVDEGRGTQDVSARLDGVHEVEPLAFYYWALIASKFQSWGTEHDRPPRDQESVKNKFNKLSNAKKKTGDPSWPSPVRRAKHIARDIQNKCAARVLGSYEEDEDDDTNILAAGGRRETL